MNFLINKINMEKEKAIEALNSLITINNDYSML